MTASERRRRNPDGLRPRGRANREGSIYPYKNGYAAYVWVTTPSGKPARKYIYGKTREIVHEKWVKLQAQAAQTPIPTATPTVAQYLTRWLADVVEPNLEPATYAYYWRPSGSTPAPSSSRCSRCRWRAAAGAGPSSGC